MRRLLLLIFGMTVQLGFGQDLPSTMYFDPATHLLSTNGQITQGIYDESVIRSIDLEFEQPNYWNLLAQNKTAQIDIPATMTVDGDAYPNVGVRFKGQTSYSQLGNSDKKSFNVTLDYLDPDQNWDGYETFNLNNSFQDRSFMREVLYLHLLRRHIPAAKGCYVHLTINDENWGLYPHVQQLNGQFLKEWFFSNNGTSWRADVPPGSSPGGPPGPQWGDGTAALNDLGSDTLEYQKYYTLKTTNKDNPWDDLVAACDVLNNTPLDQLSAVIPDYLDLDRTLWFLASEILFTDDDSYVYKGKMDYYLYWDPETGRITPLEFDGNSPMATNKVNWSPFYNADKVNYPLLNRLLAVPEIRQRYLAHFRTLLSESFDPAIVNPMIDKYAAFIDTEVQADPKKLYSYANFQSETNVLKTFFTNRYNFLKSNTEISQPTPDIGEVTMVSAAGEWSSPLADKEAVIQAEVTSSNGISSVKAYWSDQLTGNFTVVELYDDGQHNDGAAQDGTYGNVLPGMTAGSWVRFYIEAAANNPDRSVTYSPVGAEHDVYLYQVTSKLANNPDLVINELMASNDMTAMDEAGEYEDWIELYNKGTVDLDISGYYLSDKADNLTKWTLPDNTTIPADGYLIVWADENGSEGPLHANFKLSASGEVVFLSNPDLELVDQVTFGQQETDMGYARIPNGTGAFVIQEPTFQANNEGPSAIDDDASDEVSWQFHPVPAHSWLYLVGTTDEAITIRSVTGQMMWSSPGEGIQSIDTGNWPNGVYIAQSGPAVQRLVIQH
ncbi:MAG: CotH kinase family protein [Saprospiraceae bacterium]|nr:CotH kinase family protein [Saprospiraceae bacterium]